VASQSAGGPVLAQDRCVEATDARSACPIGQRREQDGPHAAMLPLVDDLDGHLGGIEVVEAHIAGDPDRRSGRW
jgi:hypothetical protein